MAGDSKGVTIFATFNWAKFKHSKMRVANKCLGHQNINVYFGTNCGTFALESLPLPISLYVSGTNFQVNVWKALLQIPPAMVVSYSQVAKAIGSPGSARAVGMAVGNNPVAFLIPCHRVIQQSGGLGGYHWGTTRKRAIHAWESARHE